MDTPKKKTYKESRQILPANQAFQAIFVNSDGEMLSKPVICWVAKEDGEGSLDITGMVAGEDGICASDDHTYPGYFFVDYCGPGENPIDFSAMAMEIARNNQDVDDEFDDFDDFEDYDDEYDFDLKPDFNPFEKVELLPREMIKNLPVVLSQISVLVREQLEQNTIPDEWKEWLGFMTKFSHLTEDESKSD